MGITYRRFALFAAMASSLAACTPKPPNQFRLPNIPGSWRTQGALAGELGSIVRIQTSGHGTTVSLVATAEDCGMHLELLDPPKKDEADDEATKAGGGAVGGKGDQTTEHARRLMPDLTAEVNWADVRKLVVRGSYRIRGGFGGGGGADRRAERNLNYHAKTYSISPHYAMKTLDEPCLELLYRKSGDKNPFRLVVGLLVLSELDGDETVELNADASVDYGPKSRRKRRQERRKNRDLVNSESSTSADYLYGDHVAGLKLAMTCEGTLVEDDLWANMVEDRWGWNERRDCKEHKR